MEKPTQIAKNHSIYLANRKAADLKTEIINDDGSLYYGWEYSYSKPVKNPFTAVPGMPVSIFFVVWNDSSPNRFTGLKTYYHDEDGNKVVDFN